MTQAPLGPRGTRPSSESEAHRLSEHYRLEQHLANKLRTATRDERRQLYASVYDEFYKNVSGPSPEEMAKDLSRQVSFLRRFLTANQVLAELGPGDCRLSFAVAPLVRRVVAIDVSREVSSTRTQPANFQLLISNGLTVPLEDRGADVVYSCQLMEHLHPEDALEQLRDIYRVLIPGGLYVCVTPNRLNGPHDVSKYFDDVATGFHLKEYTTGELVSLFEAVGFADVKVYAGAKGHYCTVPIRLVRTVERILSALAGPLRRRLASASVFRVLLGIRVVGVK